jgi:integrase
VSVRKASPTEGIYVRHSKTCTGSRCNCQPSYQAHVWSQREGKRIRRHFKSPSAAKQWRREALTALELGMLRAPSPHTLREAAEAWLEAARKGEVRNRSGDPYKPSAVRGYADTLRLRVYPAIGDRRFTNLRRSDMQDFADKLVGEGHAASTVSCTFTPLRSIYRRAANRGDVAVNPCDGIDLPAVRSGRDRIADPQEAAALLAALPAEDRALWAAALYAGLRRGELLALRWEDVDLPVGTINVVRSWDMVEGPVKPKSAKGSRKVPIASGLRALLVEHRLRTGGHGFVFGSDVSPFRPDEIRRRADAAWTKAKLKRITLHECRHTFASLMIAAGVNAKALSTYMGHANIAITMDRYGHLMPGNEAQAAELLDAYLTGVSP